MVTAKQIYTTRKKHGGNSWQVRQTVWCSPHHDNQLGKRGTAPPKTSYCAQYQHHRKSWQAWDSSTPSDSGTASEATSQVLPWSKYLGPAICGKSGREAKSSCGAGYWRQFSCSVTLKFRLVSYFENAVLLQASQAVGKSGQRRRNRPMTESLNGRRVL